jgi:hypothetical protein
VPRRHSVHGTGGLRLIGDVGALIANRAGLDLLCGSRQPVGVAADDHDRSPSRYQPGGTRLADSAAAPGDQVGPLIE